MAHSEEALPLSDEGSTGAGFYDRSNPATPGLAAPTEAERLAMMASVVANQVSLSAIDRCQPRPGARVVDVGCGDDPSLGRELVGRGLLYSPTDIREDAVAAHRAAGFPARCCPAPHLTLPDGFADVVHSRFTFAWLSPAERDAAVSEMARVGADAFSGVILDYDWSACSGPGCYLEAVEALTAVMVSAWGFDPDYGGRLESDLLRQARSLADSRRTVEVAAPVRRPAYGTEDQPGGPLGPARRILELHAASAVARLEDDAEAGEALLEPLNRLARAVATVGDYADRNPGAWLRMADIVTVTFSATR